MFLMLPSKTKKLVTNDDIYSMRVEKNNKEHKLSKYKNVNKRIMLVCSSKIFN